MTGDTVAAIATPPGEGAIAMVRLSGPDSKKILGRIFSGKPSTPRHAVFGRILDGGEVVDQALATWFEAPGSFTGEEMAEITCHGGILLAAKVLELALRHGARAAEPGEFSRRAFLNGRMDLTQAEAVMDIIRARTPLALRAAALQLEGRLGRGIEALRDGVLEAVAHLEAWIDFPEEGIDPASGRELLAKISSLEKATASLLSTADQGRILREGVRTAIVGKPNAGKSSLLNRLLGMDRAIVSETPGTTRDTIEESACLGGILFKLTDTAGLRETSDPVEREGVARTGRALEQSDLVLHVVDATEEEIPPPPREGSILVLNKSDLAPGRPAPDGAIRISCLTGEGFGELTKKMASSAGLNQSAQGPSLAAINARHKALLETARTGLAAAAELVRENRPPELAAVELRTALDALGQIVGATDTEDILGEIFGRFCIGK